jgi:drug/metabolite transporter (DMT)-like permease
LLFFAYFLLKEKITHTKIITLIIAIIWLIIINPFQIWEWSLGNMLALWAAFVFSFLVAYMRKIDWKHTIGIVLWFFFFSFLILSPSVFIWWLGDIQSNRYYILPLWLFSTGLAYLFYNLALEKIEAEISSIIAMIVSPLSAIIFAYFILSEWINIKTIIWWSLLIFAGIYLEMHNKWGNK